MKRAQGSERRAQGIFYLCLSMRKPILKKSLLIFFILATGLKGTSQFWKKPFIIEPKLHAGMTVPLYQSLAYLIEDDIYAFDIALTFPTYGNDFWEKLYNYPTTGFGFSHWSLGNNEVFGKADALYTFINLPLIRSDKFSLNHQISYGGAYLTKKFDINENPLNRAIGSSANIYLRLGIDARFKLSSSSEVIFEAGAAHFSNGKTRSPNYGLNMISSSIGIKYLFNGRSLAYQEPEIPALAERYIQSIMLSAGSKVYDNLRGTRYLTSSLSYNFDYLLTHRRRIGAGADFFYDGSLREALASDSGVPEKNLSKLIRAGLHASYSVRYKDLMMGMQLGHYIYSKYKVFTNVYSRIYVQYLITENIFWGASIRAHLGKADCFETGLGYCF